MTDASGPDWTGRLTRVRASLAGPGLDAVVVSTPANLHYLANFTGSAGLLLLGRDQAVFVIDGRYEAGVRQMLLADEMPALDVEPVARRYDLTLGEVVGKRGYTRVGFEASHVTVATLSAWQRAAAGVEWVPTYDVVEGPRRIKDAHEISIFRRGGIAMAAVAAQLPRIVRAGKTEIEVASGIEAALAEAGFSRVSFPTIVASGPNSALPHARPTTRRLGPGDMVVLDFGGVLDGYCLDLTRMAAVEPVAPQAHALYAAVRLAHGAALAAVHPGTDTSAVDAAARAVLEGRGLGEAFLHATGHGLGLDIHEAPRLARADAGASERVEPGMVFTIEPGAYVTGVGGVRLEDDVLVTADGAEVLTGAPRDLLLV
jgi:Xaa-Pro aminopeptidase